MRTCNRFLALLIAAMLLVGMMPAALATETTAPAETTVPAETTEPTETTAPAETSAWRTDYSKLELRIAVANGLNAYEYTSETWEALQEAVKQGNQMIKWRCAQTKVDAAEKAITEAMNALVKMDYSALDGVLNEVYSLIEQNPELHDAWGKLDAAVTEAKPLLVSGDQTAVDEAAAQIRQLLTELAQYNVEEEQEVEVVIQEVEVEVLPTDDYCNIPMHRTWPVLFVISAVLNVALLVALVYVIMRKRNTIDNTPLVSYDIDDDMDF